MRKIYDLVIMIGKRDQPELEYVLEMAGEHLRRLNYFVEIAYIFEESYLKNEHGFTDLTQPIYALRVWFGQLNILEVRYVFDKRFGLEMREAEVHRIENVLADRAVSVMVTNGCINLYEYARKKGEVPNSTIKEADDKSHLSLN